MNPGEQPNYWQPDEPDAVPVAPATAVAPQAAPPEPAQPIAITPHEQTYAPPSPVTPLADQQSPQNDGPIAWEASEYIHHEKDIQWFVGFGVVSIALLAVAVFFVGSWTFAALIIVMAVALVVYTRRPPRVVRYTLSAQGLHIGQQFHSFSEFRAFGVIEDGPLFSILLLPVKRFLPATNVYIAESDGEQIVDLLGNYIPIEDHELDFLDRLMRRLRL